MSAFSSTMETLLKNVDSVLSTKTVVGDAKQVGDTVIIPLVDVSFGIGAGSCYCIFNSYLRHSSCSNASAYEYYENHRLRITDT